MARATKSSLMCCWALLVSHSLFHAPSLLGRWDRDYKDETNDESDQYDKGAPDYQKGDKKDLKWRVICAGVERLIDEKSLKADNILLWMDWQVCVCACSLCLWSKELLASLLEYTLLTHLSCFSPNRPPPSVCAPSGLDTVHQPRRQGGEAQGRHVAHRLHHLLRLHACAD